jgi:ABC-type polar amino acid transport system ATPase subunit
LDEPTSALDPELREEVREVLRRVTRGAHNGEALTILLVTHEHALAHELADEIWTLDAGQIIEKREPPQK